MKSEKYLQIFNYLLKFSEIRSKPVRDIEIQESQYPEKFWLNDIIDNNFFEAVIQSNYNFENTYWIKIKKPKEPERPAFAVLPKAIQNWIEPSSLLNEEEGPQLKDTIDIEGETLNNTDFPELEKELNNYVNNCWIEDLIDYQSKYKEYQINFELFENQNKIYKNFFRIYNKVQQFGEEFELVIGVGLLNYRESTDRTKIFRHIITQRVDIEFEFSEKDSQILVSPNIESAPQIELDAIIDLTELFDSRNIIDAEDAVKKYFEETSLDNLFSDDLIFDALQIFADRFSPDGKFVNQIAKPSSANSKPAIYFAPALLFRKRNTRSFTALYQQIIENIQNQGEEVDIPTINDLIEIQECVENDPLYDQQPADSGLNIDTIYFPKEYNDEQIEIIQKAKTNNKVLVQGPPGTGKSHTIANLICHLLASGKKVLITAYTKRALEVLKDKLPKEFQNLTVNLLSSDSSSIQGLQSSVNAINDELSRINLNDYNSQIEKLAADLSSTRAKIMFNTHELLKIKEKSIRKQEINSCYYGTLTEIAEKIEKDASEYSWYSNDFYDIQNNDVYNEIAYFIESNEKYRNIDVSEFNYIIPGIDFFPSVNLVQQYRGTVDLIESYKTKESISTDQCADCEKLKSLLLELHEFYVLSENIKIGFTTELIDFYLHGNPFLIKNKIESLEQILNRIESFDLRQIDRDQEISYNVDYNLKQLKNDAKALLEYVNDGNTLSGLSFSLKKSFASKEIKEKLYIIDKIRVNGSPCDTKNELEIVIRDIEIQQDFQELSELWEWDSKIPKCSYSEKYDYYKNLFCEITKLVKIIEESEKVRTEIQSLTTLKIIPFNLKQVDEFISVANYSILVNRAKELKEVITKAEVYLAQDNLHPVAAQIMHAIKLIDHNLYEQSLHNLETLIQNQQDYSAFIDLESRLQKILPNLVDMICKEEFCIPDIPKLKKAVYFRHAQNEINKLMDVDYEQSLFIDLKESEEKERQLIAKIASQKAWSKVFERLQQNKNLRQYLEAWVQAVKKISKTGKGKRDIKFRKEAQNQMDKCKSAVPCWIMPLYKIAETIQPELGMFDYVVIDEASQLGPDAIFLLYISKNIIIVGDDKQTSPEYVGVDSNVMNPHIIKHLKDIPFANYYGTEFSFFDHARRFCDGVTVLREHFRCMPEIIEFSNKHFYAPDGKCLYPLKQYSENRLEPLKAVFCPTGYTDGDGARIVNEPEAEAITDTIAKLIEDKRYSEKTIGVIVLQGNRQAAVIEDLLLKRIGEKEFHNRKIVCGNSASFQGDERDIIFLSLVTAKNHSRSALTKPEDERRFNVAVSRAKEQIWLFHSIQIEDLSNKNDLRYKLLEHFMNQNHKPLILNTRIERTVGSQPEPFESWFEVDVYNDIVGRGFSVIPQYEVAKGKYRIDLVAVLPDGTKLAIECDGDQWHGAEEYQNDILRQKDLERWGWQFFRVKGYSYYSNREKALKPLWDILNKKGTLENPKTYLEPKKEEPAESNPSLIVELVYDSFKLEESQMNLTEELKDDTHSEPIINDKQEIVDAINVAHSEENGYKILRYFNLFRSGTYIMTKDSPLEADYVLPIYENQRNGYLLQCYDTGNINKVYISLLLNRSIGKEYKNGLNTDAELVSLNIIESESIIGLISYEHGIKKFKAHLTKNISTRDQLHLKGYKVIYTDFNKLKYKVLPIELKEDIGKLIFQSFAASGKPMDNPYYKNEWAILKKY